MKFGAKIARKYFTNLCGILFFFCYKFKHGDDAKLGIVKYPFFLSDFNETRIFRTDFWKNNQIS
jgi:hypothetical protein